LENELRSRIPEHLKILVMDDEEDIRELLSALLSKLGHEVLAASEGGQAITTYENAIEEGKPFDLVFFDLTVKEGMGGKEAIEKLRGIDQNIKAIVSSGYADSSLSDYLEYGFNALLKKPYTKLQLLEVMSDLFNQEEV
jgi:CheY-like chemotaxis protein